MDSVEPIQDLYAANVNPFETLKRLRTDVEAKRDAWQTALQQLSAFTAKMTEALHGTAAAAGVTPARARGRRVAEIEPLHDQGLSDEAIAETTGIRIDYVRSVRNKIRESRGAPTVPGPGTLARGIAVAAAAAQPAPEPEDADDEAADTAPVADDDEDEGDDGTCASRGATSSELITLLKRVPGQKARLRTTEIRNHSHAAVVDMSGTGHTLTDASGHHHRVDSFVVHKAQGHMHELTTTVMR
jgi:hypothetical protein